MVGDSPQINNGRTNDVMNKYISTLTRNYTKISQNPTLFIGKGSLGCARCQCNTGLFSRLGVAGMRCRSHDAMTTAIGNSIWPYLVNLSYNFRRFTYTSSRAGVPRAVHSLLDGTWCSGTFERACEV